MKSTDRSEWSNRLLRGDNRSCQDKSLARLMRETPRKEKEPGNRIQPAIDSAASPNQHCRLVRYPMRRMRRQDRRGLVDLGLPEMLSCLASNGTENRCKVSTSPKISEKPTRSAPASRGPRFRDLRRRFLLPNRTVLRHKWVRMRIVASGVVPGGGLWQYGDRVRLLLRPVGVCIWIFLLC